MDRAQKEQVVAELNEKLQQANAAILTDYKGLTVEEITDLRTRLVESGVEYRVVKNTLMRLASRGTGSEVLESHLTGTNAVAISYGDPADLSKVLKKYAKDNQKLKIKVGALGNRLVDAQGVIALADMPPREELLGKLVGVMAAVPTGFVSVLNAVPTSIVNVLGGVPRNFIGVLMAIQQEKEKQAANQ